MPRITRWFVGTHRLLAKTGVAARRPPLTRFCICSNCCGVMPTAAGCQGASRKSRIWITKSLPCPSDPLQGGGVGWFMESLHSFVRMHWDYEPTRPRARPRPRRQATQSMTRTRTTTRTKRRFMESLLPFLRMNWDHEPWAVPRRMKSADKSDALQTLRAVRRRPAVAKRLECVRLQLRFPKPRYDSMTGQVHGKRQPINKINGR